jgi:hypothetical protein
MTKQLDSSKKVHEILLKEKREEFYSTTGDYL